MKKLLLIALVASMFCSSSNAELIISQYYEGASSDKYLELTNTGATLDFSLTPFTLALFSNANREAWKTDAVAPTSSLTISSGTLANGASLLYKNGSAVNPTYAATAATTASVINFNGDDSMVLYNGAVGFANVEDAFGATANSFADLSYVRNAGITSGTNSDFNSAQWTQFSLAAVAAADSNSTEYLGFHVIPEPTTGVMLLGGVGMLALMRRRTR